ncbi:hypothetical protein [Okeania sp. SIO2B3]|nr:hypothetical protein [Okeania sp. SIO2B3]
MVVNIAIASMMSKYYGCVDGVKIFPVTTSFWSAAQDDKFSLL